MDSAPWPRTQKNAWIKDKASSFRVQAVEEAIALVQKHSWHGATVNAVRHTVYSQRGALIRLSIFDNRLEIENPGLLPFGLTVEDLPHGVSRLRNRVIGRVLQALGLIEPWGRDIQRMTAVYRNAGLPPPIFEEIATGFRITIPTVPVGATVDDATEQAILASMKQGQGLATRQIEAIIGLTARATRTRLARLIDRGLVREIGTSAKDPQRNYFLAEGGPHEPHARVKGSC